jgi:hypothetical protein
LTGRVSVPVGATSRDVVMIGLGALVAAVITWALVHPNPGESFPVVFRGTTQAVTPDGDGVAFRPIAGYADVFGGAYPAFEVAGENRTSAVRGEACLAPGSAEQDVIFAVADLSLVWYACLTEGIVRK